MNVFVSILKEDGPHRCHCKSLNAGVLVLTGLSSSNSEAQNWHEILKQT